MPGRHLHHGSVNDSLGQCKRRKESLLYFRYSAYSNTSRIILLLVFEMILQERPTYKNAPPFSSDQPIMDLPAALPFEPCVYHETAISPLKG